MTVSFQVLDILSTCVCACVRVCVCACVRACGRAGVRAGVRACVCNGAVLRSTGLLCQRLSCIRGIP